MTDLTVREHTREDGTVVREHTSTFPTPKPLLLPAEMLNEVIALHNMAGRLVGVYIDQAARAGYANPKALDRASLRTRVAGELSNALRVARAAARDLFDTDAELKVIETEEASE